MKEKITLSEYYQIVGLFALAKLANQKLADIEIAIADVLNHPKENIGDYGHISDEVFGDCNADELLNRIKVTVEK